MLVSQLINLTEIHVKHAVVSYGKQCSLVWTAQLEMKRSAKIYMWKTIELISVGYLFMPLYASFGTLEVISSCLPFKYFFCLFAFAQIFG